MSDEPLSNEGFKGCPFCGEPPTVGRFEAWAAAGDIVATCESAACDAHVEVYGRSVDDVRESWNRRAP